MQTEARTAIVTTEEAGRCGAEAETPEMTDAEAEEDGTEMTIDEEDLEILATTWVVEE